MNLWKKDLIQYFEEGIKNNISTRIGIEIEHFILDSKKQTAIRYSGPKGVREILSQLIEYYPDAIHFEDDDFFGFTSSDFNITLEPASQFEISIIPKESIQEISKVYKNFLNNLNSILLKYGYIVVNLGCQPVSKVNELEMIPKRRYDLMNIYFQQFGKDGIEMMRGTASMQISIDYKSEYDFSKKLQAAYFYSPIFKLLCDNSPSFEGKILNTYLKRTDIWRRVDNNSRCGILPNIFSNSYNFNDYADFIGSVKPIFLKDGQNITPTGNKTISELFDRENLSRQEIIHLLSMVFPDVRLKQFLEIRFADSVPYPFILAYCALIKGLLYYEAGLDFAITSIQKNKISEADIFQIENQLMKFGWNASIYEYSAKDFAKLVLSLAQQNLPDDEIKYLRVFEKVIEFNGIRNISDKQYISLVKELEN